MSGARWVQCLLDFRDREGELALAALRVERVARLLGEEAARPGGSLAEARLARLRAAACGRALGRGSAAGLDAGR